MLIATQLALKKILELLIDDSEMVDEFLNTSTQLKSSDPTKIWELFALVYSQDFIFEVIKKLHKKNAAQKIEDQVKSKENSFYPTLQKRSEAKSIVI